MGQRAPLRLPPVPRPRTNQHDETGQHSRPLSPYPFKRVSCFVHKARSQADTHHIRPEADAQDSSPQKAILSCGVPAGPCRQPGNLLQRSDRSERKITPSALHTRHESVSPIPYTLRHRTLQGGTIRPSPHTAVPTSPGFTMREKRENAIGVPFISNLSVYPASPHLSPLRERLHWVLKTLSAPMYCFC